MSGSNLARSLKEAAGLAERLTEQQTSLSAKQDGSTLDLVISTLTEGHVKENMVSNEAYVDGVVQSYKNADETTDALLTMAITDEINASVNLLSKLHNEVVPLHKAIFDACNKRDTDIMDENVPSVRWWSPVAPDIDIFTLVKYEERPEDKPILESIPIKGDKAIDAFTQGRLLPDPVIQALLKERNISIERAHAAFFGVNPNVSKIDTEDFNPRTHIDACLIIMNICEFYRRNVQSTFEVALDLETYEKRLDLIVKYVEYDLWYQLEVLKGSRRMNSVVLGHDWEDGKLTIYADRYFAEQYAEKVGDIRAIASASIDSKGYFVNAAPTLTQLERDKDMLIRRYELIEQKAKKEAYELRSHNRDWTLESVINGESVLEDGFSEKLKLITSEYRDKAFAIVRDDSKPFDLLERISKVVGDCVYGDPVITRFLINFNTLEPLRTTSEVDNVSLRVIQAFVITFIQQVMNNSVIREGVQYLDDEEY